MLKHNRKQTCGIYVIFCEKNFINKTEKLYNFAHFPVENINMEAQNILRVMKEHLYQQKEQYLIP